MLDLMGTHQQTDGVRLCHGRDHGHGRRFGVWSLGLTVAMVLAGAGCSFVASLGGDTAGERGEIRLLFINNTPNLVVFTAGMYDPLDEVSVPAIVQFGFDGAGLTLPPDSESTIGTLPCARVFSVGGSRLLSLAEANREALALLPESSVVGVNFFAEADEGSEAEPTLDGSALSFEAQLGADFPCGALLIVRFEFNDVGDSPFRVDFDLIPPDSTR